MTIQDVERHLEQLSHDEKANFLERLATLITQDAAEQLSRDHKEAVFRRLALYLMQVLTIQDVERHLGQLSRDKKALVFQHLALDLAHTWH